MHTGTANNQATSNSMQKDQKENMLKKSKNDPTEEKKESQKNEVKEKRLSRIQQIMDESSAVKKVSRKEFEDEGKKTEKKLREVEKSKRDRRLSFSDGDEVDIDKEMLQKIGYKGNINESMINIQNSDKIKNKESQTESEESEESQSKDKKKTKKKTIRKKPSSKDFDNSDNETGKEKKSTKTRKKPTKKKKNNTQDDSLSRSPSKNKTNKTVRKTPSRPKKFKLEERPQINVPKIEKCLESLENEPIIECCVHCCNRNVLRAAFTKNQNLLKNCFSAKKEISCFTDYWSQGYKKNAFQIAIENNDKETFTMLVKALEDINISKRECLRPQSKLSYIESGENSDMTFGGVHVRKINLSRGGKLGNNAFLEDSGINDHNKIWINEFASSLIVNEKIDPKIFDFINATCFSQLKDDTKTIKYFSYQFQFESLIYLAARAGNYKTCHYFVEKISKFSNYGFNEIHVLALSDKSEEEISMRNRTSANKKAVGNMAITPMHFAAINPNGKILKKLIEEGGDWMISDLDQRKPIHYAAACESTEPLEILLNKGANCNEMDKSKIMPLLIAAQLGRVKNVELLLTQTNIIPDFKTRFGYSAIHYAAEGGHLNVLDFLIKNNKENLDKNGPKQATPLIICSEYGWYDCVSYLLEAGAKIEKKDKLKRTALLMAVKNGHSRIAALLIQKGANIESPDSSNNYPLHYACAYGWMDILILLMKAKANINVVNSWKISCIEIAMLKNHFGIVIHILNNTDFDVDMKFDRGNTLLIHSIITLNQKSFDELIYLINEKKANVNLQNFEGKSVLHFLAEFTFERYLTRENLGYLNNSQPNYFYFNQTHGNMTDDEKKAELKKHREIYNNLVIKLLENFMKNKGDLNLPNNIGKSPLQISLEIKNIIFIQEALKNSPNLLFYDKNKENILHLLSQFLFEEENEKLMLQILEQLKSKDCSEIANMINSRGETPLIKLFLKYNNDITNYFEKIRDKETFNFKEEKYNKIEEEKKKRMSMSQNLVASQNKSQSLNESLQNALIDDEFDEENKDEGEEQEISMPQSSQNTKSLKINNKFALKAKLASRSRIMNNIQKEEKISRENKINNINLNEHEVLEIKQISVIKLNNYLEIFFQDILKQFLGFGCNYKSIVEKTRKYREKIDEDDEIVDDKSDKFTQGYNTNSQFYPNLQQISLYPRKSMTKHRRLITNVKQKSFDKPINQKQEKHKEINEFFHQKFAYSNILHLLCKYPYFSLISFFIESLDLDIQCINFNKQNLLHILLESYSEINRIDINSFKSAFSFFIKHGINIHQKDSNNNTPIYLSAKYWIKEEMNVLYELGGDINFFNSQGENALMIYVKSKDKLKVEYLLNNFRKIDVNQKDEKQRTALHYLANDENSTADIDISLKEILLEHNADLNSQDILLRTPIHYLFVKMNDEFNKEIIDPIISLDYFLKFENVDIFLNDIYGNNALHYCCQRGASICCLKLTDIYKKLILIKNKENNTALTYSMLFQQINISMILINKNANIFDNAFPLKPRGDQTLKAKPEEKKKIDENFNATPQNPNDFQDDSTLNKSINDYENEDSEEDIEDDEETNNHFHSKKNRFSGFGQKSLRSKRNSLNKNHTPYYDNCGNENINFQIFNNEDERKNGVSLFRICVKFGYQGLTYLLIDKNYGIMKGIQDSFFEKKFNLAMLLLNKEPKKEIYQNINEKGQNLFHILAIHGKYQKSAELSVFFDKLFSKDISLVDQDINGLTPLHYACENLFQSLIEFILGKVNTNLALSLKANNGFTPFHFAIRGNNISTSSEIVNILLSYNLKNLVSEKYREEMYGNDYFCTPIIHATRYYLENYNPKDKKSSLNNSLIVKLLSNSASIGEKDSFGMNCIMHCIKANNVKLLEFFLNNYMNEVKLSSVDNNGFSAIHHCICPFPEGSYENKKMLTLLLQNKFPMNIKDNKGFLPVDYALKQKTGINLNILTRFNREYDAFTVSYFDQGTNSVEWNKTYNYNEDANNYYKSKSIEIAKKIVVEITPDEVANFPLDTHKLLFDSNNKPFDVTLTKVNLLNGIYGEFMFYKMQIVHDQGRDVYILWTRWGRIGEQGAYQRTPFNSEEESVKEFKKIFRMKSGNNWEDRKNFEYKKGKYFLIKLKKSKVSHSELLQKFNLNQAPSSNLNKEIKQFCREISNTAIYFKALNGTGIDTEMLNLTYLSKDLIDKAMNILFDIKLDLEELDTIQKKMKDDGERVLKEFEVERVLKLKNKIMEKSSRYYECIPKTSMFNSALQPIDSSSALSNEFNLLNNLIYVESAVKILLGALQRQHEINPLNYILDACEIKLQNLDRNSNEYSLINKYIDNTRPTDISINRIFKIEKKGEKERIAKWNGTQNHYLLFHGSKCFNYIGILSQGLRIAPPEAPSTGLMFGKGVYFADMFEKSLGYCDYFDVEDEERINSKHSYMLICEVVLGKIFESGVDNVEFDHNLGFLRQGYESVKGVSSRGPDMNMNFVLNNGLVIPCGKIVEYELEKKNNVLSWPEYIVYDTSQIRMRYLLQIKKK